MQTCDQSRLGWTVVLRRQPARIVGGQPEGGYSDAFEIICCDCGDDPDLDYREVSPELQRIRGHYPVAAGIAAYVKHIRLHQKPHAINEPPARGNVSAPAEAPSRQCSGAQPEYPGGAQRHKCDLVLRMEGEWL